MDPLKSLEEKVNIHDIVNYEINELNRRRDENLRNKLEAVEKYFNLSITTRADALHIAITRIQGENSTCSQRCLNQVAEFYDIIHSLKERLVRSEERFRILKETSGLADNKSDVDFSSIKARVAALEEWKRFNWKETIIYSVAAIIVVVKILDWIFKIKP